MMGVILQSQSGFPSDSPSGCPLIGWDNSITASSVISTTADPDFPITNVANPATHLKWVGGYNTGDEYIQIEVANVNYLAVAKHNWGSQGIPVTVYAGILTSDVKALLHFNGSLIDSSLSPKIWTAFGNAQVSVAQTKFGTGSLLLDGTGDYITTPDHADFEFGGSVFTCDMWIRPAAVGANMQIAGKADNAGLADTNSSWGLEMTSGNVIKLSVVSGTTVTTITGATTLAANTWYHVAFERTQNATLALYVNGISQGAIGYGSTINNSTRDLTIGRMGDLPSPSWNGYIDEFRLALGVAYWQSGGAALSSFSPPSTPHPEATTEIISQQTLTDDLPIIFRFASTSIERLTIQLSVTDTTAPPEAAVIYAGQLLVLERSITIGRGHVPVTYGRRTNIVNGMSESGNFLGRIVLGEYRTSKAEFEWFTPTFYRSSIDDFLAAAQEIPFFWAWSPEEYPLETGYVWLTNDAEPEVDPATRRIALTLEMRGVA